VYKILTQSLRVSLGVRGRRIEIRYLKFEGAKGVAMATTFEQK